MYNSISPLFNFDVMPLNNLLENIKAYVRMQQVVDGLDDYVCYEDPNQPCWNIIN